MRKLITSENVNCRDSQGRNSTPLHLAAGYNHLEIAQFLLENGSDANAIDKGGLIGMYACCFPFNDFDRLQTKTISFSIT